MAHPLNARIATFYDDASGLWEDTWGVHMHHGYYGPGGTVAKDHRQAQIDLIDELLRWGNITTAARILDVGCGIGGSSLLLARRFEAQVTGITLSPVQARRARERAAEAGLSRQARFEVADALTPPFEPESFDLIWSLESGEHLPDKPRFMHTCADLLAPGGRLLMATWCHRPVPPPLTGSETRFLNRLYRVYHLPYIISIDEYEQLGADAGLTDLSTADWSAAVAPFWPAVVRSAVRPKRIVGLIRAGRSALRAALGMHLMIRGYRRGLVRFGLLQGTKR